MFRSEGDVEDLKYEIYEVKKQFGVIKSENHLLKVKVRKLQDEVGKKDHQIEHLLDPKTFPNFKKIISAKGATMILNLREQVSKLEKASIEKDAMIKKLQYDLQTTKLYAFKHLDKRKVPGLAKETISKLQLSIPYHEKEKDTDSEGSKSEHNDREGGKTKKRSVSVTRARSASPQIKFSPTSKSTSQLNDSDHFTNNLQRIKSVSSDMKAQYQGLSRDHLLSIIECLKSNQLKVSPQPSPHCIHKISGSPESDLERTELLCETPHEEIQQLQTYFMDMLSEVDSLKSTIIDLQSEQKKTSDVLQEKDSNIEKLAEEIKDLRSKSHMKNYTLRPKYGSHTSTNSYRRSSKEIENHSESSSISEELCEDKLEDKRHARIIGTRTTSIQAVTSSNDESYMSGITFDDDGKDLRNDIIRKRLQAYRKLLKNSEEPYDDDCDVQTVYIT